MKWKRGIEDKKSKDGSVDVQKFKRWQVNYGCCFIWCGCFRDNGGNDNSGGSSLVVTCCRCWCGCEFCVCRNMMRSFREISYGPNFWFFFREVGRNIKENEIVKKKRKREEKEKRKKRSYFSILQATIYNKLNLFNCFRVSGKTVQKTESKRQRSWIFEQCIQKENIWFFFFVFFEVKIWNIIYMSVDYKVDCVAYLWD